MPIFYGTDRGEEPNEKRAAYGSDRGRRLDLGRALVTVPKSHQVPQDRAPWALHIPYFDVAIYEEAEDPKKHFTLQEVKRLPQSRLPVAGSRAACLVDALQGPRDRSSCTATTRRSTTLSTGRRRSPTTCSSTAHRSSTAGRPAARVTSYTYDRESAEGRRAAPAQVHRPGGQGNRRHNRQHHRPQHGQPGAVERVAGISIRRRRSDAVISQFILAAPDVDTDNFANMAKSIEGLSRGVTLYASANDRALLVSRNFWRSYRAGDVPRPGPIVLPGIETIDVTAASTDIFALNHSGFAQNETLVKDMGKLIEGDVHPPDARSDKIKPVSSPKGGYWRLSP